MRLLLAVALLMCVCGVSGAQQGAITTSKDGTVSPLLIYSYVSTERGCKAIGGMWGDWIPADDKVHYLAAHGCVVLAQGQPQPAKQEKAQPNEAIVVSGKSGATEPKWPETKDGTLRWVAIGHLPFDLPAKEVEGPNDAFNGRTFYHTCNGVAPDWKQRVLLDSADGKHHCFAFYLLEQKP